MQIFYILKKSTNILLLIIFLVISYLLIPDYIFTGWHKLLAILFMISFSVTSVCLVEHVREKISLAKKTKDSVLSIIAAVVGLSALQVCGPLCGAGIGIGLLSAILPAVILGFLEDYSVYIIIIAIIFQIFSLYSMHCFEKMF